MVTQSCAQLLGKSDKRLLGKAKNNWERLRKGPKLRTNKVKNNQSSNRLNDRPRTIKQPKAEYGRIATKRATHLRAVGSRESLPRNNWLYAGTSTSTARDLRSGSGARSLKPTRGQEPTAEALKIQEVQEVDVGR